MGKKKRCFWAEMSPDMMKYHDEEWGVIKHNDKKLFEFLSLELSQAGLSWATVIKKRDNFMNAFHNFDFNKVAQYDSKDIKRLMLNAGIIRNIMKITAIINNARGLLKIRKEFDTFDTYVWNFVDHKQIDDKIKSEKDFKLHSDISIRMSKDLKSRGFQFIGPSVCYSFMQAVGMINDHFTYCFRHKEVKQR